MSSDDPPVRLPCEVCGLTMAAWSLDDQATLLRCDRCGHIVRDFVLAPAASRRQAFTAAPGGELRTRLTVSRLYRRIRLPVGSLVLDVGCGPDAAAARALARDGYAVVAVDPEVKGYAPQASPPTEPGEEDVVRRTTHDQALIPGPFDLAVAVHVMEHVPDPQLALHQMAACLRPGGGLYAVTPKGDSVALAFFGSAWWMLEDPTHVRFFSRESLALAVKHAGFDRVRVRDLITDSMATDAASVVRKLRKGRGPQDVQDLSVTKVVGTLGLPLNI